MDTILETASKIGRVRKHSPVNSGYLWKGTVEVGLQCWQPRALYAFNSREQKYHPHHWPDVIHSAKECPQIWQSSCPVQPAHTAWWSLSSFSIISPWCLAAASQYSNSRSRPHSLTTVSFLTEASDQGIGILYQETALVSCSTNLNSLVIAVTTRANGLITKGDKRQLLPQDRWQIFKFSLRKEFFTSQQF